MTYWTNKLYPKQTAVLKQTLRRHGSLILGDVGTGKTLIALAAIEQLKPLTILIVSPLTSLDLTWAPRLAKVSGLLTARGYADFKSNRPGTSEATPRCLLIHYQAASKIMRKLGKRPWDLVVIDEAQGLKARNSGWSRMARYLRHAKDRIAMTATPMDDSPIDLWGLMRFVDYRVFGEDFKPFADEYCRRGGFMGHNWVFRTKLLPDFLKRMELNVSRLTKKFLDLPPLTVHLVGVDMLGSQLRIYQEMAEHSIVKIDEVTIKAPLQVTRQGKLEQITGGGILDENDYPHLVGAAKVRKLDTLLRKLRGKKPIVVSCKYLHEIPMIRKVMQKHLQVVKELHGAVKDKKPRGTFTRHGRRETDRTDLINEFQDGKIDGLILQVRTGGVSIELSKASTLIMYSMNFSLIDFEQLIGRFHRGGQTEPVNVFIIHAKNSVDTKIVDDVENKHSGFYQVVDYFENQEDHMPKAKTTKTVKKAAKNGSEEAPAFGVSHAAKAAGIGAAALRVKFRKAGIKKYGKTYGWDSQKAMQADLKRADAS
jgi:SNF2 family DNA or RNA helicase